MTDSQQILEST